MSKQDVPHCKTTIAIFVQVLAGVVDSETTICYILVTSYVYPSSVAQEGTSGTEGVCNNVHGTDGVVIEVIFCPWRNERSL